MNKEKSPAFQFYPKDFLTDESVVLMSMAERGAYITLLCHAWLESGVPKEREGLARLCGLTPAAFARLWPRVEPLFCLSSDGRGRLINRRMEEERRKQEEHRQAQSESGRRGAMAKWRRHGEANAPTVATPSVPDGKPIDSPMAKNGSSSSSSSSSPTKNTNRGGWERFESIYPGEVIPDRDCQVWFSVINGPEDEALLFENLPSWLDSRKFREGYAPSAYKFLFEGHWKVQPKPEPQAKSRAAQVMETI